MMEVKDDPFVQVVHSEGHHRRVEEAMTLLGAVTVRTEEFSTPTESGYPKWLVGEAKVIQVPD